MSSPRYEERKRAKRRNVLFRQAAARLHGIDVPLYADVKQMHGGAFVEIVVWVPLEEAVKEGESVGRSVYVAAPYELRDEAVAAMNALLAQGHRVTSTWLSTLDEEGDRGARMDLADVASADVLLLLNPEEYRRSGTGGRHCEFMHAWTLGKEVVILGVRSNIFHHLSNVRVIARVEDL